jgi:HSP20 family molecular chaperone IbpA
MTAYPNNPAPTGDRKLMRWILVLQIVILGWLAKNHLDGAFHRSSHNQPTADATPSETTPPSLESSVANAPSPSSLFPGFAVFRLPPPPARRAAHPADRMRAEMERMLDEANQTFASFNSFFGMDDAWASLPASPSVDMRETDDAYELSLSAIHDDPDAFDVRLDGRLLTITSHQDTRTPNASSAQRFSSRLLLPGPVEANSPLQVTNESGRIRIRIPKPNPRTTTSTTTASR